MPFPGNTTPAAFSGFNSQPPVSSFSAPPTHPYNGAYTSMPITTTYEPPSSAGFFKSDQGQKVVVGTLILLGVCVAITSAVLYLTFTN